jgi:hypothetical protein
MKPGDFKDISVSRLLPFVQSAGLLNKWIQGLHKGSEMVDVHGTLWCPPYFYSILFYSIEYFYDNGKSSCECWWYYSCTTIAKSLYVTIPTQLPILSKHSHTTALLPCEPMLLQPLLTDAVSDILAVSSVSQSSMCSTPCVGLPLVTATVGITECTAAADWFLLTAPRISVCDGACWLVASDKSTEISNVEGETSGWHKSQGPAGDYNSRHRVEPWLASAHTVYICLWIAI